MKDGRTFYGTNVENASYPLSILAPNEPSSVLGSSLGYIRGDFNQ